MAQQKYWASKYWHADFWHDEFWATSLAQPTLSQRYFALHYWQGRYFADKYWPFGVGVSGAAAWDYFHDGYFAPKYFHAKYWGKFGSITVTPNAVTVPIVAPAIHAGRLITPAVLTVPLVVPAPIVGSKILHPTPVLLPIALPGIVIARSNPSFRGMMAFWIGGAGTLQVETQVITPAVVLSPLVVPVPLVRSGGITAVVGLPPVTQLVVPIPKLIITAKPGAVAVPIVIPAPRGIIGVRPAAVPIPLLTPTPTVTGGTPASLPSQRRFIWAMMLRRRLLLEDFDA